MYIGISGHQMRAGIDWAWVREQLRKLIADTGEIDGLWTSLATGADSVAAEEALKAGVAVKVVIPHENYNLVFGEEDRKKFALLLSESTEVVHIADQQNIEDAYLLAGHRVVDLSDSIVVVWDGKQAAGKGGTGDIVEYAKTVRKKITWIDTSMSRVVVWNEG